METSGGSETVTVSDNAPSSPNSGDLWWESDTGQLKIYYQDANSAQWVDANAGVLSSLTVWQTNSTGINTTSNVGIGTTTASAALTIGVGGTITVGTGVTFESTGQGSFTGIVTASSFRDPSGNVLGAGGSSDYVHISTTNISSATASVEITLPTGYDRFEFMFDFYSSGRAHVYMHISENNGSSYLTQAYKVSSQNNSYSSSLTWSSNTYSGVVKADRSVYSVGSIKIFRASETSGTRFISFSSGLDGASYNGSIQSAGGMSTAQTARINKVKFAATGSYTFDSGKICLYGIKDS